MRVTAGEDAPALVKDAYIMAKNSSSQWTNHIKQILDDTGFSHVWANPSGVDPSTFTAELEQRLTDHFRQNWKSELQATTGKLRTYKLIKQELKLEKYLELPTHLRVPVTRLRTSSHSLRIEQEGCAPHRRTYLLVL